MDGPPRAIAPPGPDAGDRRSCTEERHRVSRIIVDPVWMNSDIPCLREQRRRGNQWFESFAKLRTKRTSNATAISEYSPTKARKKIEDNSDIVRNPLSRIGNGRAPVMRERRSRAFLARKIVPGHSTA